MSKPCAALPPHSIEIEPWVDVRTLAAHLGFSYQTTLRMADDGLIPGKAFQSGRKTFRRFKLSAVDAALSQPTER